MTNLIQRFADFSLNLLFPPSCLNCGSEGRYLCNACDLFISEAAFLCPGCQSESPEGNTHELCKRGSSLDGLVGLWEYEGVAKKLLEAVKRQGLSHALKEAVQRACIPVLQDTERFSSFLLFLLAPDTVVSYVPMQRKKEKRKGWNHAASMCEELARIVGKDTTTLLQKVKDTPSQTELEPLERLLNPKGSFEALREKREAGEREAKNVLLVDDVWVSGATLQECAKVLKAAGVEKVWGFTLARAP